jgi:hypothetical protein
MKAIFIGMFALLLVGSISMCLGQENINDNTAITKTHEFLLNQLKDPDSTKFRYERVIRRESSGQQHVFVCGELNSKNSYGGYVGYQPYYYYVDNNSGDYAGGGYAGISNSLWNCLQIAGTPHRILVWNLFTWLQEKEIQDDYQRSICTQCTTDSTATRFQGRIK